MPTPEFYRPWRTLDRSSRNRPLPLLPITGGMIAGILLDAALQAPLWTLAGWLSMAAVIAALRSNRSLLLCALAGAVGATLHDAYWRHSPRQHIAHVGVPARVTVHCTITRIGRAPATHVTTVRWLEARVTRLIKPGPPRAAVGRLRVRVPADHHWYIGQRVALSGALQRLPPSHNPGDEHRALQWLRRGLDRRLICRSTDDIQSLAETGLRARARAAIRQNFCRQLQQARGLLLALVLGDRSQMEVQVADSFRRAGSGHFLALSGLHIGILATMAMAAARGLTVSPRRRALLAWMVIGGYGLLVTPSASVHRSLGIAALTMVATLVRCPAASLNGLCAVCCVLLIADPTALFGAGFQLTFTVTLGLILVAGRALGRRRAPFAKVGHAKRFVKDAGRAVLMTLRIAAVAWAWSLPLCAVHFEQLHPWSPVVAVCLGPVVLLTLVCGLLHLCVATIAPTLSAATAAAAGVLGASLERLAQWFAAWPGCALHGCSPHSAWVAVYYILLWFLWRRASTRSALCCTAAAAVAMCVGIMTPRTGIGDALRITVLDVPGGSATLIQQPEWGAALVDCGSAWGGPAAIGTTRRALRALHIRRLRGVFISQGTTARFNGIENLRAAGMIDHVFVTPQVREQAAGGTPAHRLLAQLDAARPATEIWLAGARAQSLPDDVDVLWPPHELHSGAATSDHTLVLKWSSPHGTALFVGHLSAQGQRGLLDTGQNLAADVLIDAVPNAAAQLGPVLLQAVDPALAVVHSATELLRERLGPRVKIHDVARIGAAHLTARAGGWTIRLPLRQPVVVPDVHAGGTSATRNSG